MNLVSCFYTNISQTLLFSGYVLASFQSRFYGFFLPDHFPTGGEPDFSDKVSILFLPFLRESVLIRFRWLLFHIVKHNDCSVGFDIEIHRIGCSAIRG